MYNEVKLIGYKLNLRKFKNSTEIISWNSFYEEKEETNQYSIFRKDFAQRQTAI